MSTRVGSVKDHKARTDLYDSKTVYCGRTMPKMELTNIGFGNPFKENAITLYRGWIFQQRSLLKRIDIELKGNILICHCLRLGERPAAYHCHCQILAELADTDPIQKRIEWMIANATYRNIPITAHMIVERYLKSYPDTEHWDIIGGIANLIFSEIVDQINDRDWQRRHADHTGAYDNITQLVHVPTIALMNRENR
jgi:hypothetical protein